MPIPSLGDLLNPGIELGSPALQTESLLSVSPWNPVFNFFGYILRSGIARLYCISVSNFFVEFLYCSPQQLHGFTVPIVHKCFNFSHPHQHFMNILFYVLIAIVLMGVW